MVAIGSLYYFDMTNKKIAEEWRKVDFNSDEAIKYYSFHAYIKQKFHIVAASLTV